MIEGYFTFSEASEYLSLPEKYLENYVKAGNEIKIVKVGRRNALLKTDVEAWKIQRNFSVTKLSKDDYFKCLEFAIRSFYSYKATSDFGTAQQRDAGKFVSNFIIGKLGEIAVAHFLKRNFDIDTKLDFDIREAVIGQDITELAKPRRGGRVYNPPKLRVAIKTSKMKNVWLIVPEKEAIDPERSSDIYIYSRVNLYQDHFFRILKDHNAFTNLTDLIPPFQDIDAEVCGFIMKSDLTATSPVISLPSPKQEIQPSFIYQSGQLHKSKDAWNSLINIL